MPRTGPGTDRPVAVVTGGAGAIGTALAHRLSEAGWSVVSLDLGADQEADDATFLTCDITDDAAVRRTFAAVDRRYGRLDLLVNNAGISAIGRFVDHDVTTHAKVMAVNYLGAVSCTQAALPALARSRGRVVVTSSVTGFAPVLGRPAYVAAKHAVTGLFTALRPELATQGIGVTLVHPTFVTGGMSEAAGRADGAERSTTGGEVTSDDVARAIVDAVARGTDQVFVGSTARAAWHLWRLAPRTYIRTMTRRLSR